MQLLYPFIQYLFGGPFGLKDYERKEKDFRKEKKKKTLFL